MPNMFRGYNNVQEEKQNLVFVSFFFFLTRIVIAVNVSEFCIYNRFSFPSSSIVFIIIQNRSFLNIVYKICGICGKMEYIGMSIISSAFRRQTFQSNLKKKIGIPFYIW